MTTAAFKRLRKAVMVRAAGFCECGCGRWIGEEGHLDHFFGRGAGRPEESVSNCWALSVPCDEAKTTNRPSSAHWLGLFIKHCTRHGFHAELEAADSTLGVKRTKELFRERDHGKTAERAK